MTNTFKKLAQGQLPASAGVLYTVPSATQAIVKTIVLTNTSVSSQTVTVYVDGVGATNNIGNLTIPAGGQATWASGNGWSVKDSTGALITTSVIALTGAITGVGSSIVPTTITANAVDNTHLADMAAHTIKGNNTGSTGDPIDLTLAQVKTDLALASTDISNFTEASQDVIGALLVDSTDIDYTYNDAGNAESIQLNAFTGDIQKTAGSLATTIVNDAVTNAKLNNVATATIKGRTTAGTGDPEDLTPTQAKGVLAIVPGDVTGFDTQVRTSRIDQMAAPNTDVSFASHKITSLADGTVATDAINLGQLTGAIEGQKRKDPVYVATTVAGGNLTLSGEQTIDGFLTSASRVLVKNQTAASANGLYLTAAGAWARTADANTALELSNASVLVQVGTLSQGDTYTSNVITTLGTDAVNWVQTSEGNTLYTADGSTLQLIGTQFSEKDGGTTNAKLATMAAHTYKGNNTGSTGAPLDLTTTQVKTDLAIVSTDLSDFTEASQDVIGGLLADSTDIDYTYNDAGNAETIQINAFTGDIAKTAGSLATAIVNDAVTNAKAANMPAHTIKGNNTGSTADPIDLTLAQVKTDLALANTDISGLGTLSTQNGTFSGSSSGTNTGDVTLASVGAVPAAAGASLSGQVLTLQPASASFPGVVTAAQFVILSNTSGTNSGNVALAAVGASPNANAATLSGQTLNIELASASFPGAITAAQFTKLANTSNTNSGDITLGSAGSSPNANAASLSGQVLTLQSASQAFPGNMSAADKLRLDSQPRNLLSDVPGGTNVKADGLYLLDATMTSGTQIINSASATFTTADQGKICGMNGAGIGGATLYGTITTRNSATQIVVSFQASTTVAASGVFLYGTDDLTAFNAAMADGGRWIWPDIQEISNRATRMLMSNSPTAITQPNTQLIGASGLTSYDVGFNERGCFIHIMRSNNPNTASLTLGVTQLTGPGIQYSAVIGSGNQAQKGSNFSGFTIECAGNVPIGVQGISSHKGYLGDIHVKNPAYRAYDFTTVGGQLGEATDFSRNLLERLSCRNLDGGSSSTTANGAVANLFANANLVLASAAAFSTSGGLGIAMTTIGGAVRPTLFQYLAVSGATLTGITCLYTIASQSAALASGAVVVPAGPFYADGMVFDGNPNSQNAGAGNVPGNSSLNVILDCSIVHAGGMARRYLNADSNKGINFLVNRASGATGVGCGYWGSSSATNTARNNTDYGGDPGLGGAVVYGPEMTGITASPLANSWDKYELGNGAPRPVSGTGAVITTSDFAVTYNGATIPGLSNRVQSAVGNAATVGGAGTATTGLVPGMFVIFPSQGPAIGTCVKFRVVLGKGAAGTACQFGLKYGIANTAADATVATGTSWTGSAAAETCVIEVVATFTAIGSGTAASIQAYMVPIRRSLTEAAITGWVTTVAAWNVPQTWTPAGFNSTLSNPGPAYLALHVLANTGTVVSALAGSLVEVITP